MQTTTIMRARYLVKFSYIGTHFRGADKLWLKTGSRHEDPQSVKGVLEIALHKLKSLIYPQVKLSSRTDSGVHALENTAHVDLERFGSSIYQPEHIALALNKYFHRHSLGVLINNIQRVPDDFDARFNALSRTYLYRLATLKKWVSPELTKPYVLHPVEEWKRCFFNKDLNFDIEKFKEGASHFPGFHDWSSFKKFDKLNTYKHNRRLLYSVEVRQSQPMLTSVTRDRKELFDYWEVEFRGRGFVHNQIRRIVGVLNAIAVNKLPMEIIKVMLQVPSKHSWPSQAITAPPHGLYLCKVEYDPKDLSEFSGSERKKTEDYSDDD